MNERFMGRIRDIDDITYDEDMCLDYAAHIVHSNEFKDEIIEAERKNESETSFFIDKILYDVLENYDSRLKPHYPSDSEWQFIIDHMKILLASEGIKITKHGWNDDDDWDEYIGDDDKRDYAIYLGW